jgi:ubiquinone/menaquinone biosynthesis C-methylase UbiE
LHEVARAGFSETAELYERVRPSYAAEGVAWLGRELGFAPGMLLVDLAAGTGKWTRLMAPFGARVIAIEPLEAMLRLLRKTTADVVVVAGLAEAIPLADSSHAQPPSTDTDPSTRRSVACTG